jgi:hypothetical protein
VGAAVDVLKFVWHWAQIAQRNWTTERSEFHDATSFRNPFSASSTLISVTSKLGFCRST